MTLLEFESAAAGTWFIAANFTSSGGVPAIGLCQDLHDLVSGLTSSNQLGQNLQGIINMMKKCFVPLAQIVQSGFAIRCGQKAILGTFTMAGKTYVAFTAKCR